MKYYSWNSNGDDYATVAGETSAESLLLTPLGFVASKRESASLVMVVDERGELPISDFPHTGVQQPRVLSASAWKVLEPFLASFGVHKPASISGVNGTFHLWATTNVVDCLDEGASEIYESLSGFRKLIKAVFRRGVSLPSVPFVIRGFEAQDIWIDGEFKRTIESSGLTGAEFRMASVVRKT